MAPTRLLADMNISPKTVDALREQGWEPSLITLRLGMSDPETVTRRLLGVLSGLEAVLRQGSVVTVDDVAVRVQRLPMIEPHR